MSILLEQLLNGISLGLVYALIALGYTMVYGILRMINFSHGEVFMVGGFVGWGVITGLLAGPGARLPGLIVVLLALISAMVARHTLMAIVAQRTTAVVAPSAGHNRRMSVNISPTRIRSDSARSARIRVSTPDWITVRAAASAAGLMAGAPARTDQPISERSSTCASHVRQDRRCACTAT